MQEHWRNDKPVSYGVREAAEKISCDVKTARKAFVMLREQGFITCVDESLFNSRTGSKARNWRLTWMPYMDKSPTNDWEKLSNEKLNQRRDIPPNKQHFSGAYCGINHYTPTITILYKGTNANNLESQRSSRHINR